MPVRCVPCNRFFKGQKELDQHIQNASAHKKQQTAPLVKPEKPQALSPRIDITKRKHGQPPSATISSSSTSQRAIPAVNTAPQGIPWSVIVESEYVTTLDALSPNCHTPTELEKNGFITRPYNPLDYANLRKCKRCNSQEKNAVGRQCIFHPSKRNKRNTKRPYKCRIDTERGCKTLPTHDFQTPLRAMKHKDFRQTPPPSAEPKFFAVVLDCEMAGVAGGASESILLCVTDYCTGTVLLNRYVCPQEPIIQMRASIHGISKSTLQKSIQQGQTLWGWEGARSELWKYIDSNTIIVGHALDDESDEVLRWSDIAEDCGWPHPDTGYDPWSD